MPKPPNASFKQPITVQSCMRFLCKCLMGVAFFGITGCQQLQVFNQSQFKNQNSNVIQPLYEEAYLKQTGIVNNQSVGNLHELPPELTTSAQASNNVNILAKQIQSESSEAVDPIEQVQQQTSDAENAFIEFVDQKKQIELVDLVQIKGLNELLFLAFNKNPNLKQSQLALQIAQKNNTINEANSLPTVNAGLDVSKAKTAVGTGDVNFSAKINTSWDLDVWGKLADQTGASKADFLATKMQLQATKDALVANILKHYFDIVKNKHSLDIQKKRILKTEEIEALIEKRFRLGLVSVSDLFSARQNSQRASAVLPQLRQQVLTSEQNLLKLLGVINPKQINQVKILLGKTGYQYPKVLLPLSMLPVQDLRRRPDLQQGYFDIRSAELNAQVAYKNLLPSISLSGAISTANENPLKLLSVEPAWNLLGQLTAPIFNGGKLKKQAKIADMQVAQKYWAFQQSLLNAVTNILNTQTTEKTIAQRIKQTENLITTSKKLAKSNNRLYPLGKVDVTQLINSELALYDLYDQRSQLQYEQCINRINLGLELGLGVK